MDAIPGKDLNTVKNIVFPISPFKNKPKIRNSNYPSRQSERLNHCVSSGSNNNVSLPFKNGDIEVGYKMVTKRKDQSKTPLVSTFGKIGHSNTNGKDALSLSNNNCKTNISMKIPNLKTVLNGNDYWDDRLIERRAGPDPLNLSLMNTKRKLVDRIKKSMIKCSDELTESSDLDLTIVKVEMQENQVPVDEESKYVDQDYKRIEHVKIKPEPFSDILEEYRPSSVIATYGHFMALPIAEHSSKSKTEPTCSDADNGLADDDEVVEMHKLICLICKRKENVWLKKSCVQGNIFICKTCGKMIDKGRLNESTPRMAECDILDVTCIKCNMTFSNALEVDLHNESVHRGQEEGSPKLRHMKPQFCGECNRTFGNVEDVCKHIKQRRHKCQYCQKLFSTNSDLKKHVNIHTNEKVYQCIYCNKTFNSRGNMVKHLETHKERQRQFKCEFCSKSFLKSDHLKVHVNTHTNEKLYECPYCKKQFNRKYCLQLHINIHTLEKIYECQLCKKICMDPSTLRKHIATHSDQRPYKCDKCDKTFKQKPHLTTHMKVHCVEQTFRCSYCDKIFFTRNTWRAHVKLHTREKSFFCIYCQKTFATKCNLMTHINNKHMTDKTYRCSYCDKVFTDPSTVRKHENIHTNNLTYQCAYCDKLFLRKTHLRSHINMHLKYKPYKCKQCDKSFAIKSYLKIHYNIHDGIKPYNCKLCGKAFTSKSSLILHNNSHTKEKLFQCSYCEKKFTQRVNLKSHIFRHHKQQLMVEPPSSTANVINLVAV